MRSVTPQLSNIEALEDWFKRNQSPYYTLYAGKTNKSDVIRRNSEIGDIDEAWEDLESMIDQYDGGYFFIFTKGDDRAANTAGFKTIYKKSFEASTSGINGAGIGSASIGIMGNAAIQKHIDEQVQKEIRILRLEDRLEAAENTTASNASFWERTVESITQDPKNVQTAIGVFGAIVQKVLGQGAPIQMAGMAEKRTNFDAEESEDVSEYDLERIEYAFDRIKPHFDPVELLEKIANYIEKDPAQAKNIFTLL